MNILLVSTYELGRQPFGLASPAAWLRKAGHQVRCMDLAVQSLNPQWVQEADLIAFYVPMHTATRLAMERLPEIELLNRTAHICFYGLYAPLNESYLRSRGVHSIIGGEYEVPLLKLCQQLTLSSAGQPPETPGSGPAIYLQKQKFLLPDRAGLPGLEEYAKFFPGDQSPRTVGYVEASRGCKHFCRHCPVVSVYNGRFRIVQRYVVLGDIRQQVEMGAGHITFGDPDFLNGPGHALPLVQALHREFPRVSYDVTIKVEHLLKYAHLLPILKETGCALVTTAVESFDDAVLSLLQKKHTRRDIFRMNQLMKEIGLELNPTFVAFTPWTSLLAYRDFLTTLVQLQWVDRVHPVQLAIRLLLPAGSLLLDIPEIQPYIGMFDEESLSYFWTHPDPAMDELQREVMALVAAYRNPLDKRQEIFRRIWLRVAEMSSEAFPYPEDQLSAVRATVPYLNEPWYC